MQELIDSVTAWFSSLTGTDISAIAVAIIGILFIVAAAKASLKIIGAVLGFFAVIYLLDPQIQEVCLDLIEKFTSTLQASSFWANVKLFFKSFS